MKNQWVGALFLLTACTLSPTIPQNGLRPSAYPLVTIDPYTNAWAVTENLYDAAPQHWTGKDMPLTGVLTVDGVDYRFMGASSPTLKTVLPNAQEAGWSGRYTFEVPEGDWTQPGYDDSLWPEGEGGFGTPQVSGNRTEWRSGTVRVRRPFSLASLPEGEVCLLVTGNDSAKVWLNGREIYDTGGKSRENDLAVLPAGALRKGENVLAAAGVNNQGRAILDFGLVVRSGGAAAGQTAQQTAVNVQAMNTDYRFTCGPVELELTFTAPLFLDRPELVSRPVNYLSYAVRSKEPHAVGIRFEAAPNWALDQPFQAYTLENERQGGFVTVKVGSQAQQVLARKGDDLRIDWGYFYLAGEEGLDKASGMTLSRDLGTVVKAEGVAYVAYDDLYSVRYFGEDLRPYWNRNGDRSIYDALGEARDAYPSLLRESRRFDRNLYREATEKGGPHYADLVAVAYRQAVTAHKLVQGPSGDLFWLSKENNSNGSIGTVDVTYPSAPLFLKYGPELVKGLLNPIFDYAESGRWTKPFPAHDLGTYPIAEGQTYPYDMPVEEAGNMLLLTAAVALYNDDPDYAERHWETLSAWAEYLSESGFDPADQLCTDDFAGRLAHNVNLSAKAILALAAYGKTADRLGKREEAVKYGVMAREMAVSWLQQAADGDHYRLTFDRPGTWSQKYNLVWDRILGLHVFPAEVAEKELAYYQTVQNPYGLPLDSRKAYTKIDWILWTASLSEDNETFMSFVEPVWRFENETPDRVPMGDWVWTDRPAWQAMKARSVVGGLFIRLL